MKKKSIILLLLFASAAVNAQQWPAITQTAKPASRWWWLGSTVDKENLDYNIRTYAAAGLGELEITPIYGVQGLDEREIPFLSPEWMEMFRYCTEVGDEVGIKIDMSTGTGWPFGGPSVNTDDAANYMSMRTTFYDSSYVIHPAQLQMPCNADFFNPKKNSGLKFAKPEDKGDVGRMTPEGPCQGPSDPTW